LEKAMRDAGEVMFYRRSGTMDFNCATCHAQTGKRIRASVLPSVYDASDWSKAISWPAHRTSQEQVRSSQHRLRGCLWQMRYPNIKNGSDASIAMISFWTDAARGELAIVPDLKR
jgi:sulfur-oxidizing protein SoxA